VSSKIPHRQEMQKALMIEASRVGGLFECSSMGAYVKIKFVLIRVMVGELRSYYMTIGPSDNDFFMNHGSIIIVSLPDTFYGLNGNIESNGNRAVFI
jgi:hypothetical protein